MVNYSTVPTIGGKEHRNTDPLVIQIEVRSNSILYLLVEDLVVGCVVVGVVGGLAVVVGLQLQVNPSPMYPSSQTQENDPTELIHIAFKWQTSGSSSARADEAPLPSTESYVWTDRPYLHSSISKTRKRNKFKVIN